MRPLPLSALLSQALVAFTIEFDNEFEHISPHRTSRFGGSPLDPWLVSMAMYLNCMRFVTDEGVTAREVEQLARTKTNWAGMLRWGHISVQDGLVRPTKKGRLGRDISRALLPEIETRWRRRFGAPLIERLRKSLYSIASRFEGDLPDCMPILGYGLYSSANLNPAPACAGASFPNLPLPCLLSKMLLQLAIDYESRAKISIAIAANVVRPISDQGAPIRDLPRLSGVSKEAIAMALKFLESRGCVILKSGMSRMVFLTETGKRVRQGYPKLVASIEKGWRERYGDPCIGLRGCLEHIIEGPVFEGLTPYPDNWRAMVPAREVLPHFPMVLHRGGYPDGS